MHSRFCLILTGWAVALTAAGGKKDEHDKIPVYPHKTGADFLDIVYWPGRGIWQLPNADGPDGEEPANGCDASLFSENALCGSAVGKGTT